MRTLAKLSPFELKDFLITAAKENAAGNPALFLNAGRGNPNWIATTPREAFFSLGQFAVEEAKRPMNLLDLGGMPQKDGIAARFDTPDPDHPALRANPFPEVTDLFCRLPLPTFSY